MAINLKSSTDVKPFRSKFSLRTYFSLFSIGIIAILTIFLSVAGYLILRNALIEYTTSTAKIFAKQLNFRINNDFIVPNMLEKGRLLLEKGSEKHRRLDTITSNYIADYSDIVKIKIFDPAGTVLYSTNPDDIGTKSISEHIHDAMKGVTTSRLTERMKPITGEQSEQGKLYKMDLLEVYVPIFRLSEHTSEMEIVGAFEIYKDISPLFNIIREKIIHVPLMLIFSMGVLYFFLQIVVRNADKIITGQNSKIEIYNAELEKAQMIVKGSIDEVIEHGSFHVRYYNSDYQLLKCWEAKKCDNEKCPSYQSDDLRCWQVAGTFCGGSIQGQFAKKFGDCRKCEVYNHAVKDRINMIGESFNNMMKLLESKHEELQEVNKKLNALIDIDPLTQTGNRRSFQKRIEYIHLMSLRYDHPYSIIICDIDEFKRYNDTYGHQQGDYALISTARVMKDNLRKTDEIFRWGGEEFVIILPEQNQLSALCIAEKLRNCVESLHIPHKSSELKMLTMSFGVASNLTDKINYISWEAVLREADNQLYAAKSGGKNCICPVMPASEAGYA